jgi:hypothetical protein
MAARAKWLLPEDGIIDPVAIEIAARGTRRVRLTTTERRMAAVLILDRGGSSNDLAQCLCLSGHAARALAASILSQAAGTAADEVA